MKKLNVTALILFSQLVSCGANKSEVNVDVKMRHYCESLEIKDRSECFKDFHKIMMMAIENNNRNDNAD